jgi:hypothetical protein
LTSEDEDPDNLVSGKPGRRENQKGAGEYQAEEMYHVS